MGVTSEPVLEPRQLNEADRAILDELHEGRASPGYLSARTGIEQTYINQRLKRLDEHGHVDNLSRGLWELVDDPRGDDRAGGGSGGDVDVEALQDALAEARDAWERADGEAVGEALDRIGALLEDDDA